MVTSRSLMLLALCILGSLVQSSTAITYKVGDASGWEVPSTPSFYDSWAMGHTFVIGDVLEFNYLPGSHNVYEVTQTELMTCDATNPIQTFTTANPKVRLTTPGKHYFICGAPGHCLMNMKLTVEVEIVAPVPPTPSTPTKPPTTPTPTTPDSPPPPSDLPAPPPRRSVPKSPPPVAPVSAPVPAPAGPAPAPKKSKKKSNKAPAPAPTSIGTLAPAPAPAATDELTSEGSVLRSTVFAVLATLMVSFGTLFF